MNHPDDCECEACYWRPASETKDDMSDEPKEVWVWGNWAFSSEKMALEHYRTDRVKGEQKPRRYVPDTVVKELVEALEGLVEGVTAEVNEKGGGGYMLARLSDARAALLHTTSKTTEKP